MDTQKIETSADPALEEQTQAAKAILAAMARVGHVHPRNDRMRDVAKDLVLADVCALLAWEDYSNAEAQDDSNYLTQRLEELLDSHQSAKDALVGLEDNDISLVLQGLLELHLRMAVQWTEEHLDRQVFLAAAFPRSGVADLIDSPLSLSDVLGYELVAAWHAACFEPATGESFSSKDVSLRRIVRTADRSLQHAVVIAVADAATSVAIARHRQEPWGKFHFLDEVPA